MRVLKIGGACLNQIPLDWRHNLSNIKQAVTKAKQEKLDLLCLPELCVTGYGCEDMFLSDWVSATATDKLLEILPWTKDIAICVGLPISINNSVYNTACFINNQEIQGFYAKYNLANEGVHYEPRWFTSWSRGHVGTITIGERAYPIGDMTFDLKSVRIGFEICEDAWQTDRPACYLAEKEIDLILNPSASHFSFGKAAFREQLVADSSKDFNCVYLYTNLLGNESGRMIYDGDILIAQSGKLIARNTRLSFQALNILGLEVNFDKSEERTKLLPDRKDKLAEFSKVVPLALFDYLRKSHSKGFVLSLSGGADSSSIATLVRHMIHLGVAELGIGPFLEKIGLPDSLKDEKAITAALLTTAYQGTKNSSEATRESANQLAKSINSTHYEWLIDEQVEGYISTAEKVLDRKLSWTSDDITLQNIQARSRSPIIWMFANINNALLLSTSNRSEGDVGYATMDGDTSGSISPIAAVDKAFILQWLKYAEQELKYEGLSAVNSLTPTAELRPIDMHQTDEDDLMPYQVMVKIERLAIKEKRSPLLVYQQLKGDYDSDQLKIWVKKFYRLWARNQWKRERIAPSFHVDDFNVDPRTWCRFPILSSGFEEELESLN
ncbi:MAG: NAD(+) synthase [Cyclobacteriaceae bacterium]|nr:NAD(+) synthase [Cyclobacteriaceae bacterium HetDA_MAG_MS6]